LCFGMMVLQVSASWVARIISMSHVCLAYLYSCLQVVYVCRCLCRTRWVLSVFWCLSY
jgi:hypothetical protein